MSKRQSYNDEEYWSRPFALDPEDGQADGHMITPDENFAQRGLLTTGTTVEQEEAAVRAYFSSATETISGRERFELGMNAIMAFNRIMQRTRR